MGDDLGSLKGNISKFFAWIMVSIVIVSLAGFGIQDVILGSTGRNIAIVGKEKISINFSKKKGKIILKHQTALTSQQSLQKPEYIFQQHLA